MSDSQLFQATPLFQAMFPSQSPEQKANEELADRMRERDEQAKDLLRRQTARALRYQADLAHDRETEARSFNRRDNPHDE